MSGLRTRCTTLLAWLVADHFILVLTAVYFLVMWLIYPHMAGRRNLANLSSNMWPLMILVTGQMFVLLVGGIDLSQTSVMAVTSVIGSMIMTSRLDPAKFEHNPLWGVILSENGGLLAGHAMAVPAAVVLMLAVGAGIGLINGLATAKLRMPPFMVTLVTMSFFSGFAIYLTQSENIMHLPDSFIRIGKGSLGPVPYAMVLALLISLAAWIILNRLVLGRWLYAVGMNLKTAAVSGVPCAGVIVFAYVFSGFCAAAGAILYSARLEAGRPTLGQNLLLDIIGSAVIGGISLFGGKGKLRWAFYGVVFFVVLDNSLNTMPLNYYAVDIIKGAVILMAAVLDVVRNRLNQTGQISVGT
ncbi:MAG: ABC transporter permease [Phycisphaerae bacterium]|nr:ABC transporter permease [Phycisphaerae bacterium]